MEIQSVLMPAPTQRPELHEVVIEDFDCGLILGCHEVTVLYRYAEECIDIEQVGDQDVERITPVTITPIWAKVRIKDDSPSKEGINILAMVEDDRVFHNLIIDLHGD